ncbi:MAG: TolC family protein [Flavobacteriales bacterium]|nr:TolC family protein [Flavobacteriales bacterium]
MAPHPILRYSAGLALAGLAFFSCKLPAHLEIRDLPSPPTYLNYGLTEKSPADSAALGSLNWKTFFRDPLLIALIDTALQRNLDLKNAEQNLFAAQALLKASGGRLWPTVNAIAGAGLTRFGRQTIDGVGNYDVNFSPNIAADQRIPNPVPDFALGFQSTWEVDISGKIRHYKKAARARFMASEEGLRFLKTQIIGAVAHLYYLLISLDTELEIIRRNIELQESALEVIEIQKQSGKINELAVKQFRTQVLDTRSLEYEKLQERLVIENALNTLLARYPARIPRKDTLNVQDLPSLIQGPVSFNYVFQRPDIKAGLHQLTGAHHHLKASKAELYPSLVLNANFGLNGFDAAGLWSVPASLAFNLLSGLTAPILNRYVLLGQYKIAFSEKNKALLDYQQKVINAAQEVVNELNRFENFRKVAQYKAEEFQLMKEASKISDQLFYTGFANYLEVLMTRQVLLRAELELTEARLQQFLASVQLLRALGGGL